MCSLSVVLYPELSQWVRTAGVKVKVSVRPQFESDGLPRCRVSAGVLPTGPCADRQTTASLAAMFGELVHLPLVRPPCESY